MLLRLAAALLATVLTVSAGACAQGAPAAPGDRSPTAALTRPPDNAARVCEGVYAFAMAKTDPNDPTVTTFLDVFAEPEKFSPDHRIAARYAFFTKEEGAARALATEATEPNLHAALATYADGWAALAAVRTAEGPRSSQPNWQPVMDLCPGVQHRIFTDLDALGR